MLILKSVVKDIFKEAGLENFTVARNNQGYLELVGSCGKSLVPITNFQIGSKLSKAERDICIDEHIKPILSEFSGTIINLIEAKGNVVKALKKLDDFKQDVKDGKIYHVANGKNVSYNTGETRLKVKAFYKDGDSQVDINIDLDTGDIRMLVESNDPTFIIEAVAIRDRMLKDLAELTVLTIMHNDAQTKQEKIAQQLAKECAI